jgi:hypothetical protein
MEQTSSQNTRFREIGKIREVAGKTCDFAMISKKNVLDKLSSYCCAPKLAEISGRFAVKSE